MGKSLSQLALSVNLAADPSILRFAPAAVPLLRSEDAAKSEISRTAPAAIANRDSRDVLASEEVSQSDTPVDAWPAPHPLRRSAARFAYLPRPNSPEKMECGCRLRGKIIHIVETVRMA